MKIPLSTPQLRILIWLYGVFDWWGGTVVLFLLICALFGSGVYLILGFIH